MKRAPVIMTADQATITAADRAFTLAAEDSTITITVISVITAVISVITVVTTATINI